MAEIAFAAGVPHNPFFPLILAGGGPGAPDIERLYGEIARRLHAARPEAIIVFTTDHYNAFFDVSVPIFSIGTGERAQGPSDYPQLEQFDMVLDPELARALQAALVAAEFDVGASQEIALDHTITAPLSLMIPRMDIPLVPFFISTSMRPIPSAQRCRALGAAIRAGLERCTFHRRVALIASGAFSFEVGGPRVSENLHVGVPDPGWADRVVALLRAAALEELVAEITPAQLERAGNASGEILNWVAMLGALGPAAPDFIEQQRDQGHAFAAWGPAV
jgi:gallate dioxygenase